MKLERAYLEHHIFKMLHGDNSTTPHFEYKVNRLFFIQSSVSIFFMRRFSAAGITGTFHILVNLVQDLSRSL